MPTKVLHTEISPDSRAILRWKNPEGNWQELYLQADDTAQIGRNRDNDLVVNDLEVSRYHAIVVWQNEKFQAKDLGSTNGTRLNGEPLLKISELADGDNLELGSTSIEFHEINEPELKPWAESKSDETYIVRQDTAQPKLIISAGPHEGQEHLIGAGKLVIGRATSKMMYDISLQDKAVSRPHAEVVRQDEKITITDLGSANGTIVNEAEIAEATEIKDGDVIEIGETIFLFRSR